MLEGKTIRIIRSTAWYLCLEDIALQHPAVFIQLLARLLPLEISGECPDSVQPSVQINLHGR